MLRFLSIRHLAVIDALEIDLDAGLTVLTGETGAGKSMLVEALDLLVGGRASADLVRTGEDTASVQAIFERADGREVIIRREVSAQGRSRAFIGDALATTAALKELGTELLELHGQHEHQALLNPESHGPLLDERVSPELLHRTRDAFEAWREARAALERTQMSAREKAARIELLSFHLGEIDKVNPQAGEDESLAAERSVLANADRLSRLSNEAYGLLYENETAALTELAGVWKRVAELAAIDPRAQPYLDQKDEVKSRLEDLSFFLREYAGELDASPARLQEVEDRLAALERLKRKHGPELADVIAKQQRLRDELAALGASEEQAAELEARVARSAKTFVAVAKEVSAARRVAGAALAKALETGLSALAMPKCRVDVRIASSDTDESRWTARGVDEVELYLSANPGEELRPLARIASGGELSRVMLALHQLTDVTPHRTLVFDEVDAGIGGEAADAVGAELQALGARCQVLCITHLPQIAARADAHLAIDKHVKGGRTLTTVSRLDAAGREQELARMIAGAAVSATVVASAREMLASRQRSETKTKGESETRSRAKAKGGRG
ncbi:MAG: DNA repair protein RecN [Acidobacteria bacterium]|nr:MAG: DNA repair protein RecN [Acidobacteriota bacterium]